MTKEKRESESPPSSDGSWETFFCFKRRRCRVTSGPCTCARPPAGGSLGSARRSTSGTCTRTWWCGSPATCRSRGRSTSPRSCRRRGTSCCRPARRSPGSLRRGGGQREGRGVILVRRHRHVSLETVHFCCCRCFIACLWKITYFGPHAMFVNDLGF